jgi:hypothetical protein
MSLVRRLEHALYSVAPAILVKVAPISDCVDAGTHWVSMVGTPVSLMPRSRASRPLTE